MLEIQHKLARCVVVECCSSNAAMARRVLLARAALAVLGVGTQAHGSLTGTAGRLPRKFEGSPALRTKAALLGQGGAAQGAARRIDQIHHWLDTLGKMRGEVHGMSVSRLAPQTQARQGPHMDQNKVPTIFSASRRVMRLKRASARQSAPTAARFILDDIIEDIVERLAFLRHQPARAAVLGDSTGVLARALAVDGCNVIDPSDLDLESPWPVEGFDLIAVIGLLDAVNDLPGALIHIRNALAPGGLMIASFVGGASLVTLRAAMLAAEPDRPAARMHPLVDPRAAPQLLQRAGFKDPVVDTHTVQVRYSLLATLVDDLRDQGLGSALADTTAPLGKGARARAQVNFAARADAGGKTPETFEIITLTGRRSLAGT